MSLKKTLIGWAVEMDENVEDVEQVSTPTKTTLPQFQSTSPTPTPITQQPVIVTGSKFKEYMSNLFKEANLPGPDFFEFTKSKENIQQATPSLDESTMFKVAFASLMTTGLTKERLLETSKHYIDIIEEDSKKFVTSYEQALNSQVQSKLDQIKSKEERLVQLTNEIQEISSSINSTKQEADSSKVKLEANLNEYLLVKQDMINKIQSDVQKINQFL